MRAAVHYALAAVILSVYSARVCPFCAEVDISKRLLLFTVSLGTVFLLRKILLKYGFLGRKFISQLKRQIALDYVFLYSQH